MKILLLILNAVLIYIALFLAFMLRTWSIPWHSWLPYRNGFISLILIYLLSLYVSGVYNQSFRSSWELFKKVFLGLLLGTLLSIVFVYIFRIKWGAFPTSIFILWYFFNLLFIFKINQFFLRRKKRIRKQVIILGEARVEDIIGKKGDFKRMRLDQIPELFKYSDVDEVVVTEKLTDVKDLNALLILQQKLKTEILFSPAIYMSLLPKRINGDSSLEALGTFWGRKSDVDEFLIRVLDVTASLILLFLMALPMLIVSILIKLSSEGSIIYRQQRVGKDGKTFMLYKFRTMVQDAEKKSGFLPATQDDPRVTQVGKILRRLRLDELPQLFNILKGEMSLVGPRPENIYRVNLHKALQGIRLAVKPGLTGLAQIRSVYDLHPKHKIKYDYLYIQKRSLLLNAYILLQTIPVMFTKKGW